MLVGAATTQVGYCSCASVEPEVGPLIGAVAEQHDQLATRAVPGSVGVPRVVVLIGQRLVGEAKAPRRCRGPRRGACGAVDRLRLGEPIGEDPEPMETG